MLTYNRLLAFTLCITAAAGMIVASNPASAASGDIPAPIQAAYQKIDQSMNARDTDASLRWYAPHAVVFDRTSKTPAQLRSESRAFRQTIRESQSVDSHTVIQNVTVQRDGTTVLLRRTVTATDITPATGILNTTVMRVTERDHWINSGGRWVINRIRLMDVSEMVNGQIMKAGE